MRHILFLTLWTAFCAGAVLGDNPTADLNFGQVRIASTWERSWLCSEIERHGSAGLNINAALVTAEVGVWPQRLSLSAGGGAGEIDLEDWGIAGSLSEFWRLGLHSTFWRSGDWRIGLAFDASHYQACAGTELAGHEFKTLFSLWQFQVRPALSWTHGKTALYGGPSITWLEGDIDIEWGRRFQGPALITKAEMGICGGVAYEVLPHLSLAVEGQTTEIGQAVSLGIAGRF